MDDTDANFETAVIERSHEVPVVVDLWASWCGPCRTLGPVLEKVVGESGGQVELAKVDVDANPQVANAFRVQSIPAVYALADGKVVDGFVGALPEPAVREWVQRLHKAPSEVERLVAAGDEASLRQAIELEPANEQAVLALAELLVERQDDGARDEALALLGRVPESATGRHIAARARVGEEAADTEGVESKLDSLLERVKADEDARREFVDLLEVLGPDDPRTAEYRKALTARLF